ncbi:MULTISPECIES: hypothetical protein [Fusobacterium]|jgi:hypothetical protein|uniref:hypothetical protein n=1 Tax=Fusobacterium TaxID=848 RepID=UPI000C70428C|nr:MULTISPECIES: hypothetical protein [Fusobacterium]
MKKILFLFVLLATFAFGKVNDTLSLFTADQLKSINEQIDEIQDKRGITVYVNTYSGDEGFVIDKAQKVVVLNIIKMEDGNPKVELKFSKDMELDDDTQSGIDDLLNLNEKSISENKNAEYVNEMLIGVDSLMENIKIEEPIVVEQELVTEKKVGFFIGMGLAFLIIFGIIVRVLMMKYKKSFKEEMDIISRN